MVTLANWRERMSEDMRLRDFRPRTQEGYALAVRQFLDRVAREPETLTDEDVRVYFLYLREDKKLAPSSINLAVHALRFFVSASRSRVAGPSGTTHARWCEVHALSSTPLAAAPS